MRSKRIGVAKCLPFALLLFMGSRPVHAQDTRQLSEVAEFYRGKSIRLLIPSTPGGDYDSRARLVARHMARFIPGNPNILPVNMPGGSGVIGANYLAATAPRDGTVIEILLQNMPVLQAISGPGAAFDVLEFGWLGNTTNSPNLVSSWYETGVKTIADVQTRELLVGAPNGTSGVLYPTALNSLIGTKFKVVTGYASGTEVNLAMERGEVGGRGSNSWASWKVTRPDWVEQGKLFHLVQVGLKRDPELPNTPLMQELANTPEDAEVLEFLSADVGISRSLVTTPGVPKERLAALQAAFMSMVQDPAFLGEAKKLNIDIVATDGMASRGVAAGIIKAPKAIIAKAKQIMTAQ